MNLILTMPAALMISTPCSTSDRSPELHVHGALRPMFHEGRIGAMLLSSGHVGHGDVPAGTTLRFPRIVTTEP